VSGTFRQISTPGAGSGGSTAGTHACAIKADQTVQCWGDVGTPCPGISVAQPAATFKQVVAGPRHACGILADGQGTPRDQTFTQLNAGDLHTCGLSVGGQLWCWGLYARQPL
jgi:hypothetical protein